MSFNILCDLWIWDLFHEYEISLGRKGNQKDAVKNQNYSQMALNILVPISLPLQDGESSPEPHWPEDEVLLSVSWHQIDDFSYPKDEASDGRFVDALILVTESQALQAESKVQDSGWGNPSSVDAEGRVGCHGFKQVQLASRDDHHHPKGRNEQGHNINESFEESRDGSDRKD